MGFGKLGNVIGVLLFQRSTLTHTYKHHLASHNINQISFGLIFHQY